MRAILALASGVFAMTAANAAPLQDDALTSATAATPVAAKTSKRVCRSIVPTGSMLAKRFCLTRDQWGAFNDINEQDTNNAMNKRGTGTCDIVCERPG